MNLTTIQIREETRKNLERKKAHPRESYDAVLQRMLEADDVPSMEEMFRRADTIKEQKRYTTKELLDMVHARRGRI